MIKPYTMVARSIWQSRKLRRAMAEDRNSALVYLNLLINPNMTAAGIVQFSVDYGVVDTFTSAQDYTRALDVLEKVDLIIREGDYAYIVGYFRIYTPMNHKHVHGTLSAIVSCPALHLARRAVAEVAEESARQRWFNPELDKEIKAISEALDTVSIPYAYPMDTVSPHLHDTTLTLKDSKGSPTRASRTSKAKLRVEGEKDFDALWQAFPARQGYSSRKRALDAYLQARSQGVAHEAIMQGVDRYRLVAQALEPRFVKQASKWLEDEGWKDETKPIESVAEMKRRQASEELARENEEILRRRANGKPGA